MHWCTSRKWKQLKQVGELITCLKVRLMLSLSKSPTGCPLQSSTCSETTGTWFIPCLFMIICTDSRSMEGVAVHGTRHLSVSNEHTSDTKSSCSRNGLLGQVSTILAQVLSAVMHQGRGVCKTLKQHFKTPGSKNQKFDWNLSDWQSMPTASLNAQIFGWKLYQSQ